MGKRTGQVSYALHAEGRQAEVRVVKVVCAPTEVMAHVHKLLNEAGARSVEVRRDGVHLFRVER
jgi:hypothetical protein